MNQPFPPTETRPSTAPALSPSRREFLRTLGLGAAAVGLFPGGNFVFGADDAHLLPEGKRLIVRSASPLNAEPALDQLFGHWITPVESFYIRSHGAVPAVNLDNFTLSVEGLVDRSLRLTVAELADRFPSVDETATLTCAGNRRNEFTGKKISGVPWGAGAIGNARWSGVSLRAVLRHCGVRPEAKHVWFEGADQIIDKTETYPFGGSIPLEKALGGSDLAGGVVLATQMNDRPLTASHGAPLRTVVPGYIGARSVKWLSKIVVSDQPSPNHYLALAYKHITEETPATLAAASPIYEYALNSVICQPKADATHSVGKVRVRGFALPNGKVGRSLKRVEVSADVGNTWKEATITSPQRDFCWSLWSADVEITQRTTGLLVRATDSSGETQPREMPWNLKGYQYNAWHQVNVKPS